MRGPGVPAGGFIVAQRRRYGKKRCRRTPPHRLPLREEWVRRPNKGPLYQGRRPVNAMIEGGIPKMVKNRPQRDAIRDGL